VKVSIITAVLNSHEIVRRQILHYEKMNLRDVEILFIDDGSVPELKDTSSMVNFDIYRTNDERPWTEHIARNIGVGLAEGEYVILIDIDYILPKESIEYVLRFTGDRINFKRRFGVLDENGDIAHDKKTLKAYSLKSRYFKETYFPGHRSQFAMRQDLFWDWVDTEKT